MLSFWSTAHQESNTVASCVGTRTSVCYVDPSRGCRCSSPRDGRKLVFKSIDDLFEEIVHHLLQDYRIAGLSDR
jgi:hypothetical protein